MTGKTVWTWLTSRAAATMRRPPLRDTTHEPLRRLQRAPFFRRQLLSSGKFSTMTTRTLAWSALGLRDDGAVMKRRVRHVEQCIASGALALVLLATIGCQDKPNFEPISALGLDEGEVQKGYDFA